MWWSGLNPGTEKVVSGGWGGNCWNLNGVQFSVFSELCHTHVDGLVLTQEPQLGDTPMGGDTGSRAHGDPPDYLCNPCANLKLFQNAKYDVKDPFG